MGSFGLLIIPPAHPFLVEECMKCNEIRHVYMKSDRALMNLVRLFRILVSLALDEHAKQYVLALFPG